MDPKKVIICRCEDVTLYEIYRAIEEGYDDLELLKRYLRIGMGPCQGTYCIPLLIRILVSKTGRSVEELHVPGKRPPLAPTLFKYFMKFKVDRNE